MDTREREKERENHDAGYCSQAFSVMGKGGESPRRPISRATYAQHWSERVGEEFYFTAKINSQTKERN